MLSLHKNRGFSVLVVGSKLQKHRVSKPSFGFVMRRKRDHLIHCKVQIDFVILRNALVHLLKQTRHLTLCLLQCIGILCFDGPL